MATSCVLLLIIGCLGAFDVAYFHAWKSRLTMRPECRREAWIHVARGFVYVAQFAVVPNLKCAGAFYWAFLALFFADAAIALMDVFAEQDSRAPQGGLPRGEYAMHIVLSVLVGAFLCTLAEQTSSWRNEPTAFLVEPHAGMGLRVTLGLMAVFCLASTLLDILALIESSLLQPEPLHIRIRVKASRERVWNVTQDHRAHPLWDWRFSRITMLFDGIATLSPKGLPPLLPDPRIGEGTLMCYERRMGFIIRGCGRYKLHRPFRQSTFQFWSDDPRSLIRKGVGLWLYKDVQDGVTELSTSYTYEVRWGSIGRSIDRWIFRPLFQRLTEASFKRLGRLYFDDPRPTVLGRKGRRPVTFELPSAT